MPTGDAIDDRLIAILRGLEPAHAEAVGLALFDAGLRVIEVPLNSPQPFRSIEILRRTLPPSCLVGAGTVLDAGDVARVADVGGRLIVTPSVDVAVIFRAVALDMTVIPGFATPSEAFAAIKAGAERLKLFPATTFGPGHLKALKDVLPQRVHVYAVGGIGPNDMRTWASVGAYGFGLGGSLFKPADRTEFIALRARESMKAVRTAFANNDNDAKGACSLGGAVGS